MSDVLCVMVMVISGNIVPGYPSLRPSLVLYAPQPHHSTALAEHSHSACVRRGGCPVGSPNQGFLWFFGGGGSDEGQGSRVAGLECRLGRGCKRRVEGTLGEGQECSMIGGRDRGRGRAVLCCARQCPPSTKNQARVPTRGAVQVETLRQVSATGFRFGFGQRVLGRVDCQAEEGK